MRKRLFIILPFLILLTACSKDIPFRDPGGEDYIAGYSRDVAGEVLPYRAPLPFVRDALLVRSMQRDQYIEWLTDTVPSSFDGDTARFIWLCAMDGHEESRRFDLFVEDQEILTFRNPEGPGKAEWMIRGEEGMTLSFRRMTIDNNGDLGGFMTLSVPAGKIRKGYPLHIRVMGESAMSRVWYMTFRYAPEPSLGIENQEAVIRDGEERKSLVRIDLVHLGDPLEAEMMVGNIKQPVTLHTGMNIWRIPVPVVTKKRKIRFLLKKEGEVLAEKYVTLMPVRQKTIYLLHHSHVDIGYTQVQSEVQRIQWSNLERALQYAGASRDEPEGERFKWNTEVMWPLVTWLRQASPEKKERMIKAIRAGEIELDALFANELTGLCRPEELMQLIAPARHLADSIGVPLRSAMISDIPGYTWGIVPVLAQNGVKYFSIGTNVFDHIGHILPEMGDKPFYWESPSGEERVLCWIHGKGYSMFHGGGQHTVENALREQEVFDYLRSLKEKKYPYDIVALRYNIGADNGPPDSLLTEAVKRWNEKYFSPRMVIATVGELFSVFEKKYGKELPVFSGDLTPYWSDGAYSSAFETVMNRASAERIVQTCALWSMIPGMKTPEKDLNKAWEDILLYDEHTWGSWNSISDPESPFTLSQWKTKRAYALRADSMTRALFADALGEMPLRPAGDTVTVINTLSWQRSGIVTLPDAGKVKHPVVTDEKGQEMPSQRDDGGRILFLAEKIPPFGVKKYIVRERHGAVPPAEAAVGDPWRLENEKLRVRLDPATGSIVSLAGKEGSIELADTMYGQGLNGYVYVQGRKPVAPLLPEKVKRIRTVRGPLFQAVVTTSEAPGCHSLTREVRLWRDGRVEIINLLDKKKIYTPEAVYFTFPFRLPQGRALMDIAWGAYRPEKDQLPGSCKNYFTIQRWVDVTTRDRGVTLFTPDAALAEVGRITTDANQTGWLKHTQQPENHIISWVMNNYWGTNYKATQEGKTRFRYDLITHDAFDRSAAKKQGMEIAQPLLALRGVLQEDVPEIPSPGEELIVTLVRPMGNGLLMRVFNPGEKVQLLTLQWKKQDRNRVVYLTDPMGKEKKEITDDLVMQPLGIVTLLIEK
jgi:hypothetical protein